MPLTLKNIRPTADSTTEQIQQSLVLVDIQQVGRQGGVDLVGLAIQYAVATTLHVQRVVLVESNHPDVAGGGVLGGGVGVGGEDVTAVAVEVEPQLTVLLGQRVHHDHVVTAAGNCVDSCGRQRRFKVVYCFNLKPLSGGVLASNN